MFYVAASDPDFDRSAEPCPGQLVDDAFTPDPDKSLEENGIRHKQSTIALIGA